MNSLAQSISDASHHNMQDLSSFIVAECEMVTQNGDGNIEEIDVEELIRAFKAWAYMHMNVGGQGD